MNNIQHSQCSHCKKQCRSEQLIPADSGAVMVCEECYRQNY